MKNALLSENEPNLWSLFNFQKKLEKFINFETSNFKLFFLHEERTFKRKWA